MYIYTFAIANSLSYNIKIDHWFLFIIKQKKIEIFCCLQVDLFLHNECVKVKAKIWTSYVVIFFFYILILWKNIHFKCFYSYPIRVALFYHKIKICQVAELSSHGEIIDLKSMWSKLNKCLHNEFFSCL